MPGINQKLEISGLNLEGRYIKSDGNTGIGGVINRDINREVLMAFITLATIKHALAAKYVIQWRIDNGFNIFQLELDSLY